MVSTLGCGPRNLSSILSVSMIAFLDWYFFLLVCVWRELWSRERETRRYIILYAPDILKSISTVKRERERVVQYIDACRRYRTVQFPFFLCTFESRRVSLPAPFVQKKRDRIVSHRIIHDSSSSAALSRLLYILIFEVLALERV